MIPIVTPVIVHRRECPRCGQEVVAGYPTCSHCGMTVPTTTRSNVFVVLGLLVAIILGVVVALQYV